MAKNQTGDRLQTIERSFDIIHLLIENGPTHLSDIANELDMAESTTHRHLKTLHELRYISRKGQQYQLGLRLARLGTAARTRKPDYLEIKSYVHRLAKETDERAHFIAEDHGLGVYLYQSTGANAVKVGANIGRQVRLHCSAAGKIILSHYSRDRVNEILDKWGLPQNTKHTITDRNVLFQELDAVRDRGFAFNREEAVEGVHAVSVPVKPEDALIGTLCIAGPSHRLQGTWFEEELPSLLLSTANELELNIEYDDSGEPTEHLVD
jgi:DNA-binding IclR family transcriptional regulator